MPENIESLGAVIQDLTTRQERLPASRNRPITLYQVNYEILNFNVDTESLTARSTPMFWTATGSTTALWGQGEFRSS